MIFRELSNAVFRFVLRCAGAEIDGVCSNTPLPLAGGGKSRGPSGRGLSVLYVVLLFLFSMFVCMNEDNHNWVIPVCGYPNKWNENEMKIFTIEIFIPKCIRWLKLLDRRRRIGYPPLPYTHVTWPLTPLCTTECQTPVLSLRAGNCIPVHLLHTILRWGRKPCVTAGRAPTARARSRPAAVVNRSLEPTYHPIPILSWTVHTYAKQTEVLTYVTHVCKRLAPSRLHELHRSKLPFDSRNELIRSKLSIVLLMCPGSVCWRYSHPDQRCYTSQQVMTCVDLQ